MYQKRVMIEEPLTKARFQFAIDCLHNIMQIKPKQNFAFSPYCIYEALTIIYLIYGHTNVPDEFEKRLKDTLYLTNLYKIDLIKYYMLRYNQPRDNAAAFYASGMIWHRKFNEFIWAQHIFSALYQRFRYVNFYIDLINDINQIIRTEGINNHIIHPVKLSAVRKDMRLILMTALRFKNQEFQISTACQSDAPNVLPIPDKRKCRKFFSHALRMHVSEFPYENDNTSLFVLLPASVNSGYWTIKQDATDTDISDLIKRFSTKKGICELSNLLNRKTTPKDDTDSSKWPTFQVEKNLKIRELLQALKLEELISFDVIQKMSYVDYKFSPHLGNVAHRTHVNVTKKNTLGGAMTLIYTGQESSPSIKQVNVNCDYPFVWLIYDKSHQNILFVGAFNKSVSPQN